MDPVVKKKLDSLFIYRQSKYPAHLDYAISLLKLWPTKGERGIEITFDTEDFFIATLTRPETIQKEVTDQVKKLLRALKTGENKRGRWF